VALATGGTPLAAYEELARRRRACGLDASRAAIVGIDEFVGVAASDPASFAAYLDRHVIGPLGFDRQRAERLNGAADNLDAECARYDRVLMAAGGLDLILLGIGANGHVGFNEPGESLAAATHVVDLEPSTRRSNAARFGGDMNAVPARALSIGMAAILGARRVLLVATGADKASGIARALTGPLTTHVPASWLQTHRDVSVYLDREAASLLRGEGVRGG
jgi:glucosamine-6-phosphate deaminase